MMGTGGLAKDTVAAVRWLALAAKAGHPPSQALLGHMLFVGNGVLDQRARGLMWLELAAGGAPNQWIRDLYQHDFRDASDNERLAAAGMRDARAKGTSSPVAARTSVTSSLQPFEVLPADR
jgi:TPR repeat protein